MPERDLAATPIVFLHAFPFNGEMWERQRNHLAGRRTLAPDVPGFGGRPAGPTTIDAYAERIVSDMDVASIDRAVLVGLSMGGYIAFRIQARWPDRVAAMVFADTRAGPDTPEIAARRTQQAERVRREGVEWLSESLLPALLGETSRRERPDVVKQVERIIGSADPEGVARALLAMRDRPDSREGLAKIDVPVLVIVGKEDTVTPPEEAREMAAQITGARLEILPGVGHLANLEDPEAFNRVLAGFLM